MAFDFYIKTQQDLIDAVKEYGIVPYFENSIPGFSIEEHAAPSAWFDSEQEGIWEWKGPVIRKTGCAYGKFFEKKAAFVRQAEAVHGGAVCGKEAHPAGRSRKPAGEGLLGGQARGEICL